MIRKVGFSSGSGSEQNDHTLTHPAGRIDVEKSASVLPDRILALSNTKVVRMWRGGPLRHLSRRKTSKTPYSYAQGCFAGSYVCAQCLESCEGLYHSREEQR